MLSSGTLALGTWQSILLVVCDGPRTDVYDNPVRQLLRSRVDAEQETLRNPLGLDEACRNCPTLADCREWVVHGYGDVEADIVVEAPTAGVEATGIPFTADDTRQGVQALLGNLGLSDSPPTAEHPEIENAYLNREISTKSTQSV